MAADAVPVVKYVQYRIVGTVLLSVKSVWASDMYHVFPTLSEICDGSDG